MRLTDIMSAADLSVWPQIALVIFLAIFTAVVIKTFAKSQQKSHDEASFLPLEDDEGNLIDDEVNKHAQA